MVALIVAVLFAAPPTLALPAERAQAVVDYADVTVEVVRGKASVVLLTPGHFAKPTALPRARGRFEARALKRGVVVERVRFDFPLLADAETEDTSPEARAVAEKLRAGLSAKTRVRVPLPDGADAVAIYDTRNHATATVDLKGSPVPPAAAAGGPPAR